MATCRHCGEEISLHFRDTPDRQVWLHYLDGRLVAHCNLFAEPV